MSRRLFHLPLPYVRLTYDEQAFYLPAVHENVYQQTAKKTNDTPKQQYCKKIKTLSTCSTCTVCGIVACDDVNVNIFIFISSSTPSTGTLRTNDKGAGGGGDITKTFREVGID